MSREKLVDCFEILHERIDTRHFAFVLGLEQKMAAANSHIKSNMAVVRLQDCIGSNLHACPPRSHPQGVTHTYTWTYTWTYFIL